WRCRSCRRRRLPPPIWRLSSSACLTRSRRELRLFPCLTRSLFAYAVFSGGYMARYSKSAGKDVARAVKRKKKGKLKRGKGGKGGTVKSRKQAIAIGLSEARKKGKKVPKKSSRKKKNSSDRKKKTR